jgi:phenylacetate-CoA ligase
MSIERVLRRRAADFIAWRDGVSGSGPAFRAFQRDARRSREDMQDHASRLLAAQIAHARATVPYYRNAWAGIEIPAGKLVASDLERLPLLTKSVIRDRAAELKTTDASVGPLTVDYTGGTTGTQVSFYRDHQCRLHRIGRQRAVLDACGYVRGMRRALVWGAKADLGDGVRKSLRARLRHFASAQIILPSIVMTEAEMASYAERLRAFRPEVMYGYPNALTQFAEYVAGTRNEIRGVHTIITTAERLSEKQRRTLHEVFGGEVYNMYASREYGCVGFECSRHEGLHIDTGSVCVEILRDGKPVPEGEVGEIVVTDLLNRGFPLVRSATGDQASINHAPCECGSPFPRLGHLDGRTADVVIRPDGGRVMGLMLTDQFMNHPTLRWVQYIQQANGSLDVNVVATVTLSTEGLAEIEREVRTLVGDEMAVNIIQLPDIERNPRSGKFQEVINRMNQSRSGGPSV